MHIGHTPTVENGLLGTESGHEIRGLTSHEANTQHPSVCMCNEKETHFYGHFKVYIYLM